MTDMFFQPAVKEKLRARVALDGPTGSGKTWTALQWARILVGPDGKIGVIDTENRSAAYYAPTPQQLAGTEPIVRANFWDPPYNFGHRPWPKPYDPIKLTSAIQVAGKQLGPDGCLIVDSFSHFWEGEGGTLDLVDAAGQRARGNRFAGWKEGTPAQRQMVDAIVFAECHVICCMRSKMEYVLDEEVSSGGQRTTKPRKIGMRPVQREGVEYEFTVIADMDLEHRLIVSKSRCDLVADMVLTKGRSHEAASIFAEWLDSGVERISADQVQVLVDVMNSVTDAPARTALKTEFVELFGPPTEVTTDRSDQVVAWLAERIKALTPPPAQTGEVAGIPEPDEPTPPATTDVTDVIPEPDAGDSNNDSSDSNNDGPDPVDDSDGSAEDLFDSASYS
jgi:hypothetical protein